MQIQIVRHTIRKLAQDTLNSQCHEKNKQTNDGDEVILACVILDWILN